jgi:peptidoglycan pentaglycine glycine transferase (the first glycine)
MSGSVQRQIFSGSSNEWNELVVSFPRPHFLQSYEWGQVKIANGWLPQPYIWRDAGGDIVAAAQLLEREVKLPGLPWQLRVQYVPRGPLLRDWGNKQLTQFVLADLREIASQREAVTVKVDPEVWIGTGEPAQSDSQPDPVGRQVVKILEQHGWQFAPDQIQFRNTVLVNLAGTEEVLLAQMKQKTRYNIRLSERKGVQVRQVVEADLPNLYQMYAVTSVRDGFVIRDEDYYQRVWRTFLHAGLAEGLIAEVDGSSIGAVMIFRFGGRAWYVYGMSLDVHRDKMPNYLLQWTALKRAKEAGCREYDLWGAPDEFEEDDPMWGVYRFKRGLGGYVARSIGAWDYPVRPVLYRLYTKVLPRLLNLLRRRGLNRTRQLAQ